VIGRPLLVGEEARTAPRAARSGWASVLQVRPLEGSNAAAFADVPAELRDQLLARWSEVAAMEHASVASFSRFALQLLALGAPAELVRLAQEAALDEVRHARIAFGVASMVGGQMIGPDRLPDGLAPLDLDPRSIVRALVLEGCAGETLGVVEAREGARGATPEIAEMLRGIADDEERHAALAWRTLRWLLETRPELAADAARAFEDAARAYAAAPEGALHAPAFGVIGGHELGELRRQTLEMVVLPCARALLVAPVATC